MTSKRVRETLARYGFEYDESVTGQFSWHSGWDGTIDPIGNLTTADVHGGQCHGTAVSGNTRAEMDAEAIAYAKEMFPMLIECTDPECEMHNHTDNH